MHVALALPVKLPLSEPGIFLTFTFLFLSSILTGGGVSEQLCGAELPDGINPQQKEKRGEEWRGEGRRREGRRRERREEDQKKLCTKAAKAIFISFRTEDLKLHVISVGLLACVLQFQPSLHDQYLPPSIYASFSTWNFDSSIYFYSVRNLRDRT